MFSYIIYSIQPKHLKFSVLICWTCVLSRGGWAVCHRWSKAAGLGVSGWWWRGRFEWWRLPHQWTGSHHVHPEHRYSTFPPFYSFHLMTLIFFMHHHWQHTSSSHLLPHWYIHQQEFWFFAPPSDAATPSPLSGAPCQPDTQNCGAPPSDCLMGSSSSSPLCNRPPILNDLHSSQTSSPTLPNNCMRSFLEEEEERLDGLEEQLAPLQEQRNEVCIHNKIEWRPRGRSSRFDSCYSTSHSESPGEEDEEDEEEEGSVFHEVRVWHCSPRGFFSDRASSGIASFDEEEEREDGEEEKKEEKEYLMWYVINLYVSLSLCWFWYDLNYTACTVNLSPLPLLPFCPLIISIQPHPPGPSLILLPHFLLL